MNQKIAIYDHFNPLAGQLKTELDSSDKWSSELITDLSKKKNDQLKKYDLLISMSYQNKDDIIDMNGLKLFYALSNKHEKLKFIFFSWFHPFHNLERFSVWYDVRDNKSDIMNVDRCRILQLPLGLDKIEKNIRELLAN